MGLSADFESGLVHLEDGVPCCQDISCMSKVRIRGDLHRIIQQSISDDSAIVAPSLKNWWQRRPG